MRHPEGEDTNAWSKQQKTFWLVVGGLLCFLWGAATVVRIVPPKGAALDFAQEWTSARNFFEGYPIYESMKISLPRHFGSTWQSVLIDVNAHPPASVLLTLPLGELGYRHAHASWNVVSLACAALSLWLILSPSGLSLSPWCLLSAGAILLTSNSWATQFIQGQLNLLLLLLITIAWAAQRSNRDSVAGAVLGIAMAIKLVPGFLLLYFLVRRRWRALILAALAFGGVNLLGTAILGSEAYLSYFRDVVPSVSSGFRDFWPNASLSGFWYKLFDARNGHVVPLAYLPNVARAGSFVCALAITGFTAWKCYQARSKSDCDWAFSLCIVAMLLVSPITWDHYFLLLILPLAIFWKYSPAVGFSRKFLIAAMVLLGTLRPKWIWDLTIPGPGELVLSQHLEPSVALPIHVVTVISYQFYALLALFVFAALRAPASLPEEVDGPRLPLVMPAEDGDLDGSCAERPLPELTAAVGK
jgi:hypothetical protein